MWSSNKKADKYLCLGLKIDIKKGSIKNIPYASILGSLTYPQVCTHPDITYDITVLGRM